MQDLIKSLMEVTGSARAKTQLFFTHEKYELSLSKTEPSMNILFIVHLPVKNQKHRRFLLFQVRPHSAPWFSCEILGTFQFPLA